MSKPKFKKITTDKTAVEFKAHIEALALNLAFDAVMQSGTDAPLAQPYKYKNREIGNRWCILPMEGWDCYADGNPSDLTKRRWLRFATSGAKLIFGCEAAAVMDSGKSNTRQMMINEDTWQNLAELRQEMVQAHIDKFGSAEDLYIGLQLTHSGRYSHPIDDKVLESKTAYSNPLLDKKFGNSAADIVSDEEVKDIIKHFIKAAKLSQQAGFDFVDIKQAHGYLAHEFLAAYDRLGEYGGCFENRTRFFREIVEGIKKEVPGLDIAMRFSLFDWIPFEKDADQVGKPMMIEGVAGPGNYKYAFGGDGSGLGYDLTEPLKLIGMAKELGIEMICTTIASPYYAPHIQRPAAYPVSDGYLTPEDPLVGVTLQINAVAEIKKHFPEVALIGAGYTYLQEWLPNVGQYAVRNGLVDFVGIGRMALSYPDMCADSLAGKELKRNLICRTFGDCTTAPRNGLVSGCYPLDSHYKEMTEALKLKEIKRQKK